jgi:HAD superfamily hydrolase (TIGR01458 family)
MKGADLIALEKDRYWMAPDGLSLSAGPFVSALEYATGKTAALVGKPSKAFFSLALDDMGLAGDQVVMIGDDILTDVGGAQQAGIRGALVRTGKFSEEALKNSGIRPDFILDSIARISRIVESDQGTTEGTRH